MDLHIDAPALSGQAPQVTPFRTGTDYGVVIVDPESGSECLLSRKIGEEYGSDYWEIRWSTVPGVQWTGESQTDRWYRYPERRSPAEKAAGIRDCEQRMAWANQSPRKIA